MRACVHPFVPLGCWSIITRVRLNQPKLRRLLVLSGNLFRCLRIRRETGCVNGAKRYTRLVIRQVPSDILAPFLLLCAHQPCGDSESEGYETGSDGEWSGDDDPLSDHGREDEDETVLRGKGG